jgi:phosphoribosylamine--glycine ligase
LGKGVILSNSTEEAAQAIDQMLLKGAFGDAGKTVVIQELVEGPEISLHALCDGRTARLFPTAQDHKRIFDEDKGPNTGGMGTYSPTPFLNDAELASIGNQILGPWISGCRAEGLDFRGLLYPGVILTNSGPRVLEFNARLGDPETQVYMTRLKSDLVEILNASVDGTLDRCELSWSVEPSVCVVVASRGYPASSTKGSIIHGLPQAAGLPGVKVFHAGTARHGSDWVTNGGRVLGVTATGANLLAARDAAYTAVETICFEGMQFRRDIAEKGIRAYALR